MATCNICGEEIEFRFVDGRRTPIHLGTGWCGRGASTAQNGCGVAPCPKCNADVFFVRHNGGAVWLDDLGPPWPIHECFRRSDKPNAFSSFKVPMALRGVFPAISVSGRYRSEYGQTVQVFSAERETHFLGILGNFSPAFRGGTLVIISPDTNQIFRGDGEITSYTARWRACKHCGTPYPPNELMKHEGGHSR
jgi:hypothetical protein